MSSPVTSGDEDAFSLAKVESYPRWSGEVPPTSYVAVFHGTNYNKPSESGKNSFLGFSLCGVAVLALHA